MTTYRGKDLPLSKVEFETPIEAGKDVNFPAVDGTAFMPFGKRKRPISVKGRVFGQTRAGLRDFLRQFPTNCVGTLVQPGGFSFENVRCKDAGYTNTMMNAADNLLTAEYQLQLEELFP